jgi:hypothetical protein
MESNLLRDLFVLMGLLPAIMSVVRGRQRRDRPRKLVRDAILNAWWACLVLVLILPRASLGSRVAFVMGLLLLLGGVWSTWVDVRSQRRQVKTADPPVP